MNKIIDWFYGFALWKNKVLRHLLILFLAILIIKSIIVILTNNSPIIYYDEHSYTYAVREIRQGNLSIFYDTSSILKQKATPFIYPLTLSISDSYAIHKIINVILTTIILFPIYKIFRNFIDHKYAMLYTGIVCFTPNLLTYNPLIMTENIIAVFLIMGCYFFIQSNRSKLGILLLSITGVTLLSLFFVKFVNPLLSTKIIKVFTTETNILELLYNHSMILFILGYWITIVFILYLFTRWKHIDCKLKRLLTYTGALSALLVFMSSVYLINSTNGFYTRYIGIVIPLLFIVGFLGFEHYLKHKEHKILICLSIITSIPLLLFTIPQGSPSANILDIIWFLQLPYGFIIYVGFIFVLIFCCLRYAKIKIIKPRTLLVLAIIFIHCTAIFGNLNYINQINRNDIASDIGEYIQENNIKNVSIQYMPYSLHNYIYASIWFWNPGINLTYGCNSTYYISTNTSDDTIVKIFTYSGETAFILYKKVFK